MLGIIGAMDVEVDAIKALIQSPAVKTAAGLEFVSGRIENTEVCAVRCNPGKVNAALCTQLMLDLYDIEKVINLGVGCSLNENVVIKDVVVATGVCQYDFDTSAVDGVKGLIIDGKTAIAADKELSDALAKAAEKAGARVHRGVIATGDCFIASDELKRSIVEDFGAVCGEMEGGAIGQVCYINKVPFAVLRCVSDGGDSSVQIDYPTFKPIAAEQSARAIINFLKQ